MHRTGLGGCTAAVALAKELRSRSCRVFPPSGGVVSGEVRLFMTENVGGWDRRMRWGLGATALVVALTAPIPRGWRISLVSFAATEFLTAGTRYCPLNQALGINTRTQDLKEAVEGAAHQAASLAT